MEERFGMDIYEGTQMLVVAGAGDLIHEDQPPGGNATHIQRRHFMESRRLWRPDIIRYDTPLPSNWPKSQCMVNGLDVWNAILVKV